MYKQDMQVEMVCSILSDHTHWPGILRDITSFIKKCSIPNNYSNKRKNFQKYDSILKGPFEKIGIGVIGPFPKNESKNRFIVAGTDYVTRWAEARPIKNKSKEEIGRFIF